MPRLGSWLAVLVALVLPAIADARAQSPPHPHSAHRATGRGAVATPPPARVRAIGKVGDRNPVAAALAVAERYWGGVPCGGHIGIHANWPLAPGMDTGIDAWVTFGSSLGADDLAAPPSTYTACTIYMAHWQWGSWADMEGDWGMFCLTMTHEVGHLLGHPHDLTAGSVMAPVFTSDANVPRICQATWLPGWRLP